MIVVLVPTDYGRSKQSMSSVKPRLDISNPMYMDNSRGFLRANDGCSVSQTNRKKTHRDQNTRSLQARGTAEILKGKGIVQRARDTRKTV